MAAHAVTLVWLMQFQNNMTPDEREDAQVERAKRTHAAVLKAMAAEHPGTNTYTWRDRYLVLFHMLWDRQQQPARGADVES